MYIYILISFQHKCSQPLFILYGFKGVQTNFALYPQQIRQATPRHATLIFH